MNIAKLMQTVNYVLSRFNGKLNYTKLIKLLYLADRDAMALSNESITGDTYISMPYGPVLENVYSLIKGIANDPIKQAQWNVFFVTSSFDLVALQNTGSEELSVMEAQILDAVIDKYKDLPYNAIIDVVHNKAICPEWQNPHGSSLPLLKKDILKAIGRNDEEIKSIEEENETYAKEDMVFNKLEAKWQYGKHS